MELDNLRKQTVRGVLWSAIERLAPQGIQFIVLLVVARILTPKDFGLVGMVTVFTSIAQTLIDSGFSQALIRKQNRTEVDNSTTFYFNIVIGFLLYGVFYIISPLVSRFYNEPSLCNIMRVVCVSMIFNSFAVVQRALYTATVNFKIQAKASTYAALGSGFVGVGFALTGYGVWSIVFQQLTNTGLNTLFLWLYSKWRPRCVFSWNAFKELFSFGGKILVSGLINTLYQNIYQLTIGKFYSASSLGNYTNARHFAELPSSNISRILQRVTYPILCVYQNDLQQLVKVYRKFIRVSCYIIFPLMVIIAGESKSIVLVFLGPQWSYCATLLTIICFEKMWYPIHHLNVNILQAMGRSDLTLKIEVYKKIMGVIILILTIPLGVEAMCYGSIASSLVSLYINTFYVGKLTGVCFSKQMRDVAPTFILSIVTFSILVLLQITFSNAYLFLIVGIILGMGFFISVTWLLNFQEFKEIVSLIKK